MNIYSCYRILENLFIFRTFPQNINGRCQLAHFGITLELKINIYILIQFYICTVFSYAFRI
jgi:hypothetical protein